MTSKQMTYGEAIRTPGTKLYAMAQQQQREFEARKHLTPAQRKAYWDSVCKKS